MMIRFSRDRRTDASNLIYIISTCHSLGTYSSRVTVAADVMKEICISGGQAGMGK